MSARNLWWCATLLSLACARPSQGPGYVGTTGKLVFGFNEKGKVLWKLPQAGVRLSAISDSVWVGGTPAPAALVALEPSTGKELWRWSAEGTLVGMGWDSIPPDSIVVACTVERATEMLHVRFQPRTGQVVASWTRPNELPWQEPREGAMCPAGPVQHLIEVAVSSTTAFGFDQEARLRWSLPLRTGEGMRLTNLRYVFLETESGLRSVDRQTGKVLWEREYPSRIRFTSCDGDYVQVTLADGSSWVHEAGTGEPYVAKEGGAAATTRGTTSGSRR